MNETKDPQTIPGVESNVYFSPTRWHYVESGVLAPWRWEHREGTKLGFCQEGLNLTPARDQLCDLGQGT